jgi:hypothetical protein
MHESFCDFWYFHSYSSFTDASMLLLLHLFLSLLQPLKDLVLRYWPSQSMKEFKLTMLRALAMRLFLIGTTDFYFTLLDLVIFVSFLFIWLGSVIILIKYLSSLYSEEQTDQNVSFELSFSSFLVYTFGKLKLLSYNSFFM